jgi:hypothetical protein
MPGSIHTDDRRVACDQYEKLFSGSVADQLMNCAHLYHRVDRNGPLRIGLLQISPR